MEIIKKGQPLKYYDLECPRCHSILRVGEHELTEYEDCYDTSITTTRQRCPNCGGSGDIAVETRRLHEYQAFNVKGPKNLGMAVAAITIIAVIVAATIVFGFIN